MRVVGDACDCAGNGQHATKLGVDEGEQNGDGAADAPGEDGGRSGKLGSVERGEQPARADDPRKQQRDGTDLALEASACLRSFAHAAPAPRALRSALFASRYK